MNFISRVKDAAGQWIENIEGIKASVTNFFTTLFCSDREGRETPQVDFAVPKLNQLENSELHKLPTMEELKEVIFSMSQDSAPGPDGFSAGFYQASWVIICEDLLDAVLEFFEGGQQPRGFTSTSIVLIPKVVGASQWKEFRSISLCNFSSKLISKILANRINRLLPRLVSDWQTGFVPGREIVDNILLAQELVLDLDRRLKHSNLILKLDMEKTYDRVEWSFLLFMLRQFGFNEGNVNLIFQSFSNNWFSILREESRYYVSVGNRVPYLAFADDILIFARCSEDCLDGHSALFRRCAILEGASYLLFIDGLVARMQDRLFHWSSRLLSSGGGVKGIQWRSWDRFCYPVDEGGLGFRSFVDMSRAFACKLWWKLRKRDSIWVEFMHFKYIRGVHPMVAQVNRPPLPWRQLDKVRSIVESKIRWYLGRGFVDFWFDHWLSDRSLAEMAAVSDPPHMLLAEFYGDKGWSRDMLNNWLPTHLVQQVLQVQLFPDQDDLMVWGDSSSGSFSLKTAWAAVRRRRNMSIVDQRLWNATIPLKISFFVWKVLRGIVPVDLVLQNRGINLASCCSCCSAQGESLLHLFLDGPVAAQVWTHFKRRFGMLASNSNSVSAMCLTWFYSSSCVKWDHIMVMLLCLILWFLWKGRNKARFEGLPFDARGVIDMVESFAVQLGRAKVFKVAHFRGDSDDPWRALATSCCTHVHYLAVAWHRPPFQVVKLNTDASVCHGRGARGACSVTMRASSSLHSIRISGR
ncbi:uncharacterized protein LOC113759880 [Coffea eugenioides]|uniref:uncharacterized protein LOC113759880 n=1 Tax=Coffea eugenioides TaxID=49369 RepID=UPI000F605324|nr:uncharacterized protein LOC113759880 [Coffea eugenioides]